LRAAGVWQVWDFEDEYEDDKEDECSVGLTVLVLVLGFFIVPHNPNKKQLLYLDQSLTKRAGDQQPTANSQLPVAN
jgi:hypothetical protein